jgi:serralysin
MVKPFFTNSQIVTQLTTSWGGSEEGYTETWRGKSVISYAIPTTAPTLSSYEAPGFKTMTPGQVAFARLAFELWDDLIAPSLTETTSNSANITFAYSSKTQGGGTYTQGYTGALSGKDHLITAERIWMNSTWSSHDTDADMYYGGYGLITFIHEIGHSLGLSHPGTYDAGNGGTITYTANAEYAQDTRQYSVMSYFDADEGDPTVDHYGSDGRWKYAQTPLVDDILAIQAKYGADTTTRTGNTVYGFGSNAGRDVYNFAVNKDPIIAIWDAGGTDTLDVSGYTTNQKISLVAGTFSDVGYMTRNVAIAFGATIENAVGGAGADTLIGNDVANRLTGGKGADTLTGAGGADTFVFHSGDGRDVITDFHVGVDHIETSGYAGYTLSQVGADTLVTFSSADTILLKSVQASTVTAASFAMNGAVSPPPVSPPPVSPPPVSPPPVSPPPVSPPPTATGVYDHTYVGDANGNTLTGTALKDLIQGLAGNDLLSGLAGADRLEGGAGVDRLAGGDGDDVLQGGTGADIISLGTGADTILFARGDGADSVFEFSLGTGDRIHVSGYTSYTLQAAGADTRIVFSSTDSILLKSVAPAQVNGSAIVFTSASGEAALHPAADVDTVPRAAHPDLADPEPTPLVESASVFSAVQSHGWWF